MPATLVSIFCCGLAISKVQQMQARAMRSRISAPPARSAASPAGEHEEVPETVPRRLDADPQAMQRLKPVEHPFGTMKARIGTTHPDEDAAEGCERNSAQWAAR